MRRLLASSRRHWATLALVQLACDLRKHRDRHPRAKVRIASVTVAGSPLLTTAGAPLGRARVIPPGLAVNEEREGFVGWSAIQTTG